MLCKNCAAFNRTRVSLCNPSRRPVHRRQHIRVTGRYNALLSTTLTTQAAIVEGRYIQPRQHADFKYWGIVGASRAQPVGFAGGDYFHRVYWRA